MCILFGFRIKHACQGVWPRHASKRRRLRYLRFLRVQAHSAEYVGDDVIKPFYASSHDDCERRLIKLLITHPVFDANGDLVGQWTE